MADTDLDAAKDEALTEEVDDIEVVEEESVETEDVEPEETEDEETEVDIDEILPKDHKERSELGRKVSALLSKSDKLEEIIIRQQEMIERLAGPIDEDDPDDDVPMTLGEYKKLTQKQQADSSQYENDFKESFATLTKKMDEQEAEAIGTILLEKFNVRSTNNGLIDGTAAFYNAKQYYDKLKEKKVPLNGGKARGVMKKQVQTKTVKPLTKLDKDSEKYLDYVKRTRGEEAATRLRKEVS